MKAKWFRRLGAIMSITGMIYPIIGYYLVKLNIASEETLMFLGDFTPPFLIILVGVGCMLILHGLLKCKEEVEK